MAAAIRRSVCSSIGRPEVRAMPARPDISALCCREGDAWWDPRSESRGCIPASSLLWLLPHSALLQDHWEGRGGVAFPPRCNADASAVAGAISLGTLSELLDYHWFIT